MSRQLPVPSRSSRSRSNVPAVIRPDVIVVDGAEGGVSRSAAFGRTLLALTPDLLRVIERSLANRQPRRANETRAPATELRAYRNVVQLSEVEYDMRAPFVRKVTVRKATAWASDLPFVAPETAPAQRGGRLRLAGVAGLGGACALAAIGLLANRGGLLGGPRRGV